MADRRYISSDPKLNSEHENNVRHAWGTLAGVAAELAETAGGLATLEAMLNLFVHSMSELGMQESAIETLEAAIEDLKNRVSLTVNAPPGANPETRN